jgi:hypothetical protein
VHRMRDDTEAAYTAKVLAKLRTSSQNAGTFIQTSESIAPTNGSEDQGDDV